ncbi:MAG: hypothetical protein C0433_18805 [Cyclobacterium sp.]|nr:hypothetical protein [Cyclobacterium sp.]
MCQTERSRSPVSTPQNLKHRNAQVNQYLGLLSPETKNILVPIFEEKIQNHISEIRNQNG